MKPLTPREYSQESFVSSAVELGNKLKQERIGNYRIYPLLVGFLDNLLLGFEKKSFTSDSVKGVLGVVKAMFSSRQKRNLDVDVLFASTNSADIRYTQLFDPLIEQLAVDSVKSSHHSAISLLKEVRFGVLVKSIVLNFIHYSRVSRVIDIITTTAPELRKYKAGIRACVFSQLTYAMSAQRQLEKGKLKLLVVDWDHASNQALVVEAARQLSVQTITLVHGNIAVPSKFVPILADHCYTWGDLQSEFFNHFGTPERSLRKVGFPSISYPRPDDSKEIASVIPKGPKYWIGYAEQRVRSLDNAAIAKDLSRCLEMLGEDWGVMVRPHPSQSYEKLVDVFERYPRTWVIPKRFKATEVLSQANLFLVVDSTFSLDCIFYHTPLVFYNPGDRGLFGMVQSFVEQSNAVVVRSGQELGEMLKDVSVDHLPDLTHSKSLHSYAQKYVGAIDVDSVKNMKRELILEINKVE